MGVRQRGGDPRGYIQQAAGAVRKVRILGCFAVACVVAGVGACAGRSPQPVAVVQPRDRYMDCSAIEAEAQGNNAQVQELASEEGFKVAQNVAAGVAGLFIWPLWFGMDFQGAASKETAALQNRQQYLETLAEQNRCGALVMTAQGSAHRTASAQASPPSPSNAVSPPRVPAAMGAPQAATAQVVRPPEPIASQPSAATGAQGPGRVVLFPVTIYNPYYPPGVFVDVR
jgi:hypothetical protein